MSKKHIRKSLILGVLLFTVMSSVTMSGQEKEKDNRIAPLAILAFEERGDAVEGYGSKVTDIMFAELVGDPDLYLVDRSEMDKMPKEAELNLSGMVTPDKATQVGQLTGAKLLLTGSVFEVGDNIYLVAKLIGTETSRVLGESVKGLPKKGLDTLAEELADKIADNVKTQKQELLPPPADSRDIAAELREKLGDSERPLVAVQVQEEHVGRQQTLDPAVETELVKIAREAGFEVVDPDRNNIGDAEVLIKGEGFSEFAASRGNLVSVKARLELKAVNPETDRVITSDRQTEVVVDLSEQIAAKKALQKAAAKLAERLLPLIVE
ncbi:MAG: CsgG/HfaB family protein [Verrucomicrobiota bacterium]